MNEIRCQRLIRQAIGVFALELSDRIVLTEASVRLLHANPVDCRARWG